MTKWCPGVKHVPYDTRLKSLDLPTLTDRFNRGDLIETFKILKNHYDIPSKHFFTVSHNNRSRGQSKIESIPLLDG